MDFVVVWTRFDEVIDPDSGQPVIDPVTGRPWTDANIYARYFTDEVQRLTIPTELTADAVAGQFGYFTLKYGGNEVQKLTISATYQPQQGSYYGQSSVSGSITLGIRRQRQRRNRSRRINDGRLQRTGFPGHDGQQHSDCLTGPRRGLGRRDGQPDQSQGVRNPLWRFLARQQSAARQRPEHELRERLPAGRADRNDPGAG